ncbi:hypothetical protein R3P38DRAFT_3207082 [Favolaschia claudopus]|uniref:Uncharacterized protein n=1 Tax=Favolaschia claudopus TaxID=2862362 RepID=A0AAW0AJ48_9AGAR
MTSLNVQPPLAAFLEELFQWQTPFPHLPPAIISHICQRPTRPHFSSARYSTSHVHCICGRLCCPDGARDASCAAPQPHRSDEEKGMDDDIRASQAEVRMTRCCTMGSADDSSNDGSDVGLLRFEFLPAAQAVLPRGLVLESRRPRLVGITVGLNPTPVFLLYSCFRGRSPPRGLLCWRHVAFTASPWNSNVPAVSAARHEEARALGD